jgi:hypothetical protein
LAALCLCGECSFTGNPQQPFLCAERSPATARALLLIANLGNRLKRLSRLRFFKTNFCCWSYLRGNYRIAPFADLPVYVTDFFAQLYWIL